MKLRTPLTLMQLPLLPSRRTDSSRRARSSRRSRYAAKTACLSGLIVLLLVHSAVGLYLAIHQRDDHVYSNRSELFEKRLREVRDAQTLNVVMLGSSRVQHGISPRLVEKQVEEALKQPCVSLSFACAGSGPIAQWLYLRRLIDEGRKVDFLIVEIFPTNMGLNDGQPVEALWLNPERIRPNEGPFLARYGLDESEVGESPFSRQAMVKSWDRWRFRILGQIDRRLVPRNVMLELETYGDSRGWWPITRTLAPPAKRPQRTASLLSTLGFLERWQPAPMVHAALCDMLRECRNRGIHVVLTFMPEASEFRSRYSPAAMEDIHRYLDSLQREWHVSVAFAQDWLPDSAFMDAHHLYEDGAAEFTARFCRERLLPYMTRSLAEGTASKK